MIYVVTVHWRSPRWIHPQLAYLRRNVRAPFKVFASLNGIRDQSLWQEFDHADELDGHHGAKLNKLARSVAAVADPSDVLIFMDSDAFPIRPIDGWLEKRLADYPLIAVQRKENFGDLRPHPSFCATTVGFWEQLGGDWTRDTWTTPDGVELEDAGTRVLLSLEEAHVQWLPLVRTNNREGHPLWFGVYGHYVYHHGAGSRTVWSVIDDRRVFTDTGSGDAEPGVTRHRVQEGPEHRAQVPTAPLARSGDGDRPIGPTDPKADAAECSPAPVRPGLRPAVGGPRLLSRVRRFLSRRRLISATLCPGVLPARQRLRHPHGLPGTTGSTSATVVDRYSRDCLVAS